MPPLASHLLLALAVAATGGAAVRLATPVVPLGLGRAVAAAVLAGALIVAQALLLGLVALGGNAIALSIAAGLAWLVVRLTLPEPPTRLRDDLATAWARLDRPGRFVAAALAGVAAVWTLWLLLYPSIGFDGSTYHLPEALAWVGNGRPGSVTPLMYGLPVGNYPLTDEVLRAWGMAIGQSFVWPTVVTPAAVLLALAAGWLGLRVLRIDRATAALALLAAASSPVLVLQLNSPSTDLTALAWLACCAGLSALAVAERSERALALAMVAAGLAVGTKTTTAPLAAIAPATAAWVLAGRLGIRGAKAPAGRFEGRPSARPLGVALLVGSLAALGVGGVWYLRNLIDHGSPLWPFVAAPWGTPSPPILQALSPSLLDRPRETLEGNLDDYATVLAGAALLLLAVPLSALLAHRRAVLGAALVALFTLLAWANAPVTGRGDIPEVAKLATSTTRYLLPGIAAAAFALALAARDAGRVGRGIALGLLVASAGWSVVQDSELGFPQLPSLATLVTGALLGLAALAGMELRARRRQRAPRRTLPAAARAALAVGLAGLFASSLASGFVKRHARLGPAAFDSAVVSWFSSQPGFGTGTRPIAFAPTKVASLAGDRLTHPLELIGVDEPCERIRGRLREGYVVVRHGPSSVLATRPPARFPNYGTAPACLRALRPDYATGDFRVYAPGAPARRSARSPACIPSRTC